MGFWLWYCKLLFNKFNSNMNKADAVNNLLIKYERKLTKKEQKIMNELRAKQFKQFIEGWNNDTRNMQQR